MFDLTLPYLREVNFFHTVTEGRPTYLTPGHGILVRDPLGGVAQPTAFWLYLVVFGGI